MVKRKSVAGATCPVARALEVLGDWWTLLIVRDAFDGISRFGDFQRSLGISKGILASRLKALVKADILRHAPDAENGGPGAYVLTAPGRDLFPVMVSLRQWGEAHRFAPGEPHSRLVERVSGQPARRLRLEAADGSQLGPDETEVVEKR